MTAHGIRFDAPSDQFITRELDVFLGPNYLVTHHHGPHPREPPGQRR